MHVEWILMDVSRYLMDSGGFLLPGSGLVKRPDPLALKLVTVECLGQHQSFALKIGSQELIPWTLDGQRAVCPGWAAPGNRIRWALRSPSLCYISFSPKSWVITSYRIPFGTGFWNHSYEMLWTQMNTTSCYGQTIGILVRGFHGSQMVTHRSIMIHPNFDSFPFISYFWWLRSRFGMLWSNSDSSMALAPTALSGTTFLIKSTACCRKCGKNGALNEHWRIQYPIYCHIVPQTNSLTMRMNCQFSEESYLSSPNSWQHHHVSVSLPPAF